MSITVTEMTFEDMADSYGWRFDTLLDGKKHYVTKDDRERAVVGPVRHKRSWRKRNKKVQTEGQSAVTFERLADTDELSEHMKVVNEMQERTFLKGLPTIDLREAFKMGPKPVEKKPGLLRRAAEWLHASFWDEEWHKRCRDLMWSTILFAFMVGSLLVIGKTVVWAVMH